jgi:hypothetical protein
MKKSKALCVGCRDDFYNGQNPMGVKECWGYATAKVVQRFRLGWWITPDTPGAFEKVTTLSCHHAPGRYAHFERLPDCARKK